ncbi:glycosyltransferase [Paenibacillus lemnae]|uniref:Glycosyltransferase n=2 Tax=Paenibacillus lemnae TaxID=1330551 RepID=A0A848M4P5_PAELE|nr:glycosyltransferase [Paenibacillus lemnae]
MPRRYGGASVSTQEWSRAAWMAGRRAGRSISDPQRASEAWTQWIEECSVPSKPLYRLLPALAQSFRDGFEEGSGRNLEHPLLPEASRRTSAVICIHNEAEALPDIMTELKQMRLHEIIVVVHGCSDDSFTAARSFEGVTVIHVPERLSDEAARALGAKMSTGDNILFTSSDQRVPAEELGVFIAAASRGVDVALNDITARLPDFKDQDAVIRCRSFLNRMLDRDDLEANSMADIPHALTRRAIETIGTHNLAIPAKAHSLALVKGLRVESIYPAGDFSNFGQGDSSRDLKHDEAVTVGDHIEAVGGLMEELGPRLRWGNLPRSKWSAWRNG